MKKISGKGFVWHGGGINIANNYNHGPINACKGVCVLWWCWGWEGEINSRVLLLFSRSLWEPLATVLSLEIPLKRSLARNICLPGGLEAMLHSCSYCPTDD